VASHLVILAPALAVGVCPQVIVLVLVEFVPVQAPLPVRVNVAVKDPLVTVGVKVARAGLAFCVQVPRPAPPLHAWELYVPVAVAPVIVTDARGVPLHLVILDPAVATGVCDHDIVLVLVGFVPVHAPDPVSVRVAVKLPLIVVGVKRARAGLAFCVQLPNPPPPDQLFELYVPVAEAPAIAMNEVPVALHLFIAAPALGTGVCDQDITLVLVGFVPAQDPPPVTVRVAVKLPEEVVGVNVARAGFAFCVQLPSPPPPLHVAELYVPPALAPVIAIGARGVASHLLRSAPAVAEGPGLTVS